MKLSIERGTLLKALAQAQSVVERRNTIPILANVLIEAEGIRAALLAPTDPTVPGAPGPLPTLTLWVVDGTLDTLLSLLRQIAGLLPEQAPA